jgi:hypothetical protein
MAAAEPEGPSAHEQAAVQMDQVERLLGAYPEIGADPTLRTELEMAHRAGQNIEGIAQEISLAVQAINSGQEPVVTTSVAKDYVARVQQNQEQAQNFNLFAGKSQEEQAQEQESGMGMFSGLMAGLVGIGAALGAAKDRAVAAIGQTLRNNGVEAGPEVSMAELGNIAPSINVAQTKSIDRGIG